MDIFTDITNISCRNYRDASIDKKRPRGGSRQGCIKHV